MKKFSVVVNAEIETLKIIERLNLDPEALLKEIVEIKKKEYQEKWKEENKESMDALNEFHEKHGYLSDDLIDKKVSDS